MFEGSMLKLSGDLFYLVIALSAVYGTWGVYREYRATRATVIKTHIIAHELQRLIGSRARQV